MENIICNRSENIDLLIPYINKPVYIKGHCWNKSFDGWTVIYKGKKLLRGISSLSFDYKGESYPVFGFLPSRFTTGTSSMYNNAFYKEQINI